MALTFQGVSISDIDSGIITKIEIAEQGGSYQVAGDFTGASIQVNPLSMRSDPSDSELVYALEFVCSFTLVQTDSSQEIAAMNGTSGTGLYETDVEVKFTFLSGRTITLGSVTAYPMRLTLAYQSGGEDGAQKIECNGRTIEPFTSFPSKVA